MNGTRNPNPSCSGPVGNRCPPTRASATGRWAVPVLAAVLVTALTACTAGPAAPKSDGATGTGRPSPDPTGSSADSSAESRPTPSAATSRAASPGVTPIRVTVGDQRFTAELYDNPTARDLADQLPVTLSVDDLHGLEKTGRLPRALTTRGVPAGADPEVDEIGYYAPGRNLVLYYADVGYYTGIIRIGRFSHSIAAIAAQPDGVPVTVERG